MDTPELSRRQLLVTGGLSLSAVLLGGCRSTGGTGSTQPTSPAETVKPSGVSRTTQSLGEGLDIKNVNELSAFTFSSEAGTKPDLPARMSIAEVDAHENHVLQAATMAMACKDRGMDFQRANARSNAATAVRQVESFLQRGTGAVQLLPLGIDIENVSMKVMESGAALFNEIQGPSTCQQVADQYAVGKAHGQMAVEWIRKNRDGEAKVAYINASSLAPTLVARTQGALEALAEEPKIEVINIGAGVKDWNPTGGFKITQSLLQANPDVTGILSGDTVIQGALNAVRAAHNETVDYIAGVDGEELVLKEIEEKGLIKGTVGFAYGSMGYATGQFAADWLEGKTIPQVMIFNPIKLDSADAIAEFRNQSENPSQYWKDEKYSSFLGGISYDTRNNWIQNALVGGPS